MAAITSAGLSQSTSYSPIVKGFQNSYLNEATGDLQTSIKNLKDIYDEDSYETKLQLKKFREAKVLFNKALMNSPGGQSALEGLDALE
jgi:hypothetical protein